MRRLIQWFSKPATNGFFIIILALGVAGYIGITLNGNRLTNYVAAAWHRLNPPPLEQTPQWRSFKPTGYTLRQDPALITPGFSTEDACLTALKEKEKLDLAHHYYCTPEFPKD
jgi:hypothetical protein